MSGNIVSENRDIVRCDYFRIRNIDLPNVVVIIIGIEQLIIQSRHSYPRWIFRTVHLLDWDRIRYSVIVKIDSYQGVGRVRGHTVVIGYKEVIFGRT